MEVLSSRRAAVGSARRDAPIMRTLILIYIATLVQCYRSEVRGVRHGGRSLIRHGRSRVHFARMHGRVRDLVVQIEAERSSELGKVVLFNAKFSIYKTLHTIQLFFEQWLCLWRDWFTSLMSKNMTGFSRLFPSEKLPIFSYISPDILGTYENYTHHYFNEKLRIVMMLIKFCYGNLITSLEDRWKINLW